MLTKIDLKRALFEDINNVHDRIQSALLEIRNEKLRAAAAHILNAGGKRIRPAVMLTAYKAAGGKEIEKAYSVAVALELIHNWTLIHDDIIDDSDVRRNVTTVHVEWDNDVAILSGDMLNNLAFKLVANSGFPDRVITRLTNIMAQASMDVMDGEMMDVDFETMPEINEEEYYAMIARKTGALFTSAAKMGGVMAGTSEDVITALEEYGRYVGRAFQVQDDMLDLIADGELFGKEIGKDIKEGKRTLMVIHTLANANHTDRETLREILDSGQANASEVSEAIGIMRSAGAFDYARQVLDSSVEGALRHLAKLSPSEYHDVLEELAHFMKDRVN